MTTAGTTTLLFTDLVGSTELLDRLGDEAAERLRREHFRLLRESVRTAGGHEVKNLGDGLMVAFGSAGDAVRCAVLMQQSVERRNREIGGEELSVRIGLHVGEPIRDEDDYFGTPVVIAKRLCDRAEGGQVLASTLVRDLIGARPEFGFRELGPLALKGIASPLAACEVTWTPAAPGEAPAIPLPPQLSSVERTPFVSREGELRQLRAQWELVQQGRIQLALIAGEPGIGKTRLATELALEAHGDGATVLFGWCDEDSVAPYRPWVEAIRYYARTCPADTFLEQAGAGGAELARIVPELPASLSLPPATEAAGEDARYRLFEAVLTLLVAASTSRPLVIILDDLQWADGPTLQLLKHIARSPRHAALFLVGTYRDTDLGRAHPLADALADLRRARAFTR
ncbi:MAG TPA: adenylate/guanylate cyclase domain-containing protein, partial [Dehalococcoidia bacterium]|nr:adenylate/guanylate cyclase domain-containing protein [Dehalococcoidia bacterium]